MRLPWFDLHGGLPLRSLSLSGLLLRGLPLSGFVVVAILCCLPAAPSVAHELRPAIVQITHKSGRPLDILITLNLEAVLAEIGPKHSDTDDSPRAAHYKRLRALGPNELAKKFGAFQNQWLDSISLWLGAARVRPSVSAIEIPPPGDVTLARKTKVRLVAVVPRGAHTLQWQYAARFGANLVRVARDGEERPLTQWLRAGVKSSKISLSGGSLQSRLHLMADYVVVGFTHIVPKGLDHILFVLGLFLLSTRLRPLLIQVTAFTVAHSITLALGLYGVVQISPAIVEPLIAASIAYVALENVLTSRLSLWRPFVVFGFGLLHGLGFAGVLRDIGLPRSEFVLGLVGFNVGVELGQLAVIVCAWLATGLWFASRPWYRRRIVVPASIAIGVVGAYWTVERLLLNGMI